MVGEAFARDLPSSPQRASGAAAQQGYEHFGLWGGKKGWGKETNKS